MIFNEFDLIAFDMDGTLLNSQKEVSPLTREALKEADAAGKLIALCTGRCLSELWKPLESLPWVRYLICESGAIVYDVREKRLLRQHTIDPALFGRILEAAEQEDVMLQMMSEGRSLLTKEQIPQMPHYRIEVYQKMFEEVGTKLLSTKSYLERCYQIVRESAPDDEVQWMSKAPKAAGESSADARIDGDWNCLADGSHIPPAGMEKINLYHTDTDARERTLRRLDGMPLEMVYSEITSLEISPRGVSKGTGLHELCSETEIDIRRTIAVGDAPNDLPALREAGLSIAMGNASEEIKTACDVTVADNDHDGCREAILKYLLS